MSHYHIMSESFILVEFPASLNVLIDVTHHYPPVLIVRYGGLRYDFVANQQHFCYIVIFLL